MSTIMSKRSHSDLNALKGKGGLFDVEAPAEMLANMGREIKFKPNPALGSLAFSERWFVGDVQRIYNGDLAYRVYMVGDTFGRPASIGSFDWVVDV